MLIKGDIKNFYFSITESVVDSILKCFRNLGIDIPIKVENIIMIAKKQIARGNNII